MKNICNIAILVIALLYTTSIFFQIDILPALFVSSLFLFLCGFPQQGKEFKKITLFFLSIGAAILIYYQLPLLSWMQSLVSMTNVIAIIVVMQLFTLPIEIGKYSSTIEYWLKKSFAKESSLFLFVMLITHIFASFLLFGTVPVMVSLFSKALKNNIPNYKRFLAVAIVRGYSMAMCWAPGAVIMLIVLQVTEVSWFDLFVPGFLLSIIGLATAYGFEHITRLNKPILTKVTTGETELQAAGVAYRQSAHIVFVVLGLLILISFFEMLSFGTGTGRILLAGLLVAGFWLWYYRKHPRIGKVLRTHWDSGILKASDLAVFFVAIGLFSGAVGKSGILVQLQPTFQHAVNQLGMFSILAVPLIFIILAIIGIHPFILAVILGKILMALSLPLPPVSIALLLLTASCISFIGSPFAGMVLNTSKFLNVSPVKLSVKWNLAYSSLFLVEGILFACLWERLS